MPPTQIPLELVTQSIDWQLALDNVGGDKELLQEITVCFLEEVPRLVAEMRQAIENGDASSLERTVSALRGDLRYFGLAPVVKAVFELQLKARVPCGAGPRKHAGNLSDRLAGRRLCGPDPARLHGLRICGCADQSRKAAGARGRSREAEVLSQAEPHFLEMERGPAGAAKNLERTALSGFARFL
jgi:HPt (histidine-containing phosphotransfer) domain-containing protein